jgi:Nickel responsive protein SCO4226-like
MNAYLVERYLPGLSEADVRAALQRAQAACDELTAGGTQIRYRGSIFLPLEEACFCRFDSDSPDAITLVNERARFALTRITAGVAITPEGLVARGRALALETSHSPINQSGGFYPCQSDSHR